MGGSLIPLTVPTRVKVIVRVCGDGPFVATFALPGEYPCATNRYGAVSILANDGRPLGLRPGEFEALERAENPAFRS